MVDHRLPWRDEFNQPTPKQLRSALPTGTVELFDCAQRTLRNLAGVHEDVAWYGPSWCWALEYRTEQQGEPLAILIPSPDDLQLAMPLDRPFIESLPMSRMRRSVRDGLDLAQEPFDTNWGVWSIGHPTILDDLGDLLRRRMTHLTGSTKRN